MNLAAPTQVRMSEHFLLSDLMGCNSIYAKGHRNLFDLHDTSKMREGRTLAESLLEPLVDRSRLSVTYGYISPELSRQIVKYQDPDKPSYHRWDAGAACDVVLHQYVAASVPAIYAACWIDENLPTSRTITYSESNCICVSTRHAEVQSDKPRRALYENRYQGPDAAKPLYINYSNNERRRTEQKAEIGEGLKAHGWKGAGYPTYHGGGTMQTQHRRTSKYTLLSDFLMSETAMTEGHPNMPVLTRRMMSRFHRAGLVYDALIEATRARRFSIIQAYQSEHWRGEAKSNWLDGAYMVLCPPESMEADTLAHEAEQIGAVSSVRVYKDLVWLTMLDEHKDEGTKKVQAASVEEAAAASTPQRSPARVRRTRPAPG